MIKSSLGNLDILKLRKTAEKRNAFMLDLADEIVIGYVSKNGMLIKIIGENNKQSKIHWLTK
jgi:hypothetical protein